MLADTLWVLMQDSPIVRLVVAAALGALIGLEREHHGRAAGLRTHLLVALGSAMAMLVSLHFGKVYGGGGEGEAILIDPARLAHGVMVGIGFLGAGAIICYGAGVRGLTTAASLWCVAAIGLGAGFGMFLIAAVGTAIVLFALTVLDFADHLIHGRVSKNVSLTVADSSAEPAKRFQKLLTEAKANVVNVNYTRDFEANISVVTLSISIRGKDLQAALEHLRNGAPDIKRMTVE